ADRRLDGRGRGRREPQPSDASRNGARRGCDHPHPLLRPRGGDRQNVRQQRDRTVRQLLLAESGRQLARAPLRGSDGGHPGARRAGAQLDDLGPGTRLCDVVRKLGVPAVRVPVTAPFTRAPLQWNAYTFLDRFLIDGGTALTLVLVAATGTIAGYLWARARAGATVAILVYSISAPALVFAYRQNLIELVLLAAVLAAVLLLLARVLAPLTTSRSRRPVQPAG